MSDVIFESGPELRNVLTNDPTVVLIVGARVEQKNAKTDVYILFKDDLLDSLDADAHSLLIEAFQKAAEYVLNRTPSRTPGGGNEKAN